MVQMRDRSATLRLPTVAVPVRLALVGRDPISVEIFVPDHGRLDRNDLLDDVAALVDMDAHFLPVRGGDEVHLYGKHAIAWLAAKLEDGVSLYEDSHRVAVLLASGTTVTGMLFDSAPADRTRVVDHLNRTRRFLRLWTSDEHYLINTQQIVRVTEQE